MSRANKKKKRPVFFSAFGFRAPKKRAQKRAKTAFGQKKRAKAKNRAKKNGQKKKTPGFFWPSVLRPFFFARFFALS